MKFNFQSSKINSFQFREELKITRNVEMIFLQYELFNKEELNLGRLTNLIIDLHRRATMACYNVQPWISRGLWRYMEICDKQSLE